MFLWCLIFRFFKWVYLINKLTKCAHKNLSRQFSWQFLCPWKLELFSCRVNKSLWSFLSYRTQWWVWMLCQNLLNCPSTLSRLSCQWWSHLTKGCLSLWRCLRAPTTPCCFSPGASRQCQTSYMSPHGELAVPWSRYNGGYFHVYIKLFYFFLLSLY